MRKKEVLAAEENGERARVKGKRHLYVRFGYYLLGLALFYVPASLFVRAFYGLQGQHLVGNVCDSLNLRMGVGGLLKLETWQKVLAADPRSLGIFAVLGVAFLFGPLFCGWICAAGALPEALSRLVPDRFKLDPAGKVNAAAIRYGFLLGFVSLPFLGLSAGCAFCNYRITNMFTLGLTGGFIPALTSTYLVTIALWLVAGGLFTKGGRGWCNFLCPVGAIQSLAYGLGSRWGFTWKVRYAPEKCRTCLTCVKVCPMRAVSPAQEGQWPETARGEGVVLNRHTCIVCQDCVASCPHGALGYGRGSLALPRPAPVFPQPVRRRTFWWSGTMGASGR